MILKGHQIKAQRACLCGLCTGIDLHDRVALCMWPCQYSSTEAELVVKDLHEKREAEHSTALRTLC